MARIRLGDFGAAIAPPVPFNQRRGMREAFVTPEGGLADSATAAAGHLLAGERQAAKEAEHEAKRLALQAEAQRKHDEEQARRNRAVAAFATYRVESDNLASDIGNRLTEGQLKREDAPKELDAALGKLRKTHLDPLDPASQATLADNLILYDGHARAKLQQELRNSARKDRIDAFQSAVEGYQRLALTDRSSAMMQAEALFKGEGAALLGADKAGKGLQQFREQVTFTDIDRRITASAMNGRGLANLQKELAGAQYADLAPERRGFLESKIQRAQQHLESRAEIAERRRLNALGIQERRLAWYVENGRDIPQSEFDSFVRASKGTPYEGMAGMIVSEQKAVSALTGLTPDRMLAKVKEVEAGYGATPSKEQIVHLDKLKRFTERSIKQLTESPLTYAVEREGAKLAPLDLANPTSWSDNLAARASVLTEQSKRTGVAPKGLFPQEVQAFTNLMRSAPPEQKRELFAQLRKGFGDDKVFKATMQQIAPDDPVTAVAGIYAARGLQTNKDRVVADYILRGQQILRPNKKEDGSPGKGGLLPMPKEDALLQAFSTFENNAFAGHEQTRSAFYQTARAIYAARSVEEGDFSGELKSKRWESAMALATGGIKSHNGKAVVMPYGYDYDTFKDGVSDRAKAIEVSGRLAEGLEASKLKSMPLENVGDGRYIFRVGDGVLVGKDGAPIVIDFNEPVAPSGPSWKPSDDKAGGR